MPKITCGFTKIMNIQGQDDRKRDEVKKREREKQDVLDTLPEWKKKLLEKKS